MYFKRFCAGLLCISLFFSTGLVHKIPVHASSLEPIQTEPQSQLTQEPEPEDHGGDEDETVPQEMKPQETTGSAEPDPTIMPTGDGEQGATDQSDAEPDGTEPITPIAEETEAPTEPVPDAGPQEGDLGTVSGQGITFRLFNYSTDINKAAGGTSWRPISRYFTFRNSGMESGTDAAAAAVPNPETNTEHDQDGFTKNHATVERVLVGGFPILDLTRNADGSARTNPGLEQSARSLRYLFSAGDHAVTAYAPGNTILQQSGSHYWYNSAQHAVDYDIEANRFRLRNYGERNSTTAGYGAAYGDFLPFTYTGGIEQGITDAGIPHHVDSKNTDYWFGMTMQVNFFQTKGGRLGDENMVFSFSGDDDVWVFVDDVLVLDLGGTHGTVNGSINFATGEIRQYLSWRGANASEAARKDGSSTSFPTNLRACFDAAGRMPNGGWSKNGQTFADFSEHTLKFYYLERGAAVANCSLDFRLPTLPDESLTVTKDLVSQTDEDVRDYIADSLYYRFRVMKADADGNRTDEPFLTAGMTYTLLENGIKTGSGTVGEDNTFLLKAGQSAQFTQMLRKGNGATQYVVEEIMPDDLTGQYEGVEYLVSGEGGDTVTEDNPAEPFTSFGTGVLSADQTQTVTFRNRVDTEKLGTLKITKLAAPGTRIPDDLYFQIQVRLGESLLPAGSTYKVGEEQRIVETAGILFLRAGETAVIEQGVLSGTNCYVTELSSSLDGYRASYSGTIQPEGQMMCDEDGASGTFPLSGTVHVTIVNADYDFSLEIPIRKTVQDFRERDSFSFLVEQVEWIDNKWQVVKTLPETAITVENDGTAQAGATVGFRSAEEGVFYYRITEKHGAGSYFYDRAVFLVEVTVAGGTAEITGIRRNGVQTDAVSFVNRRVTALTVTKTVTGGTGARKFPFTVEIFLNGKPFEVPVSSEGAYTVDGNRISFALCHGEQITLSMIPIGAVVTVEEHDYEGFLVFTELDGDGQQIGGAVREIPFSNSPLTVCYTNQTGFRLPNTGGTGTILYTASGTMLMSAALLYKRVRKGRRKDGSPA